MICELKTKRFDGILSEYIYAYLLVCCENQKGLVDMGKSLKGKELGKGIRQREDGLYVARFINRFGKRQVIYDKTYNGIQKKMREAQYADENAINVVNTNMTLDEWYEKWMYTCKKNCRGNTKRSYAIHYKRVQPDLGWRTVEETEIFLEEAKSSIYYNLFIVALETGMRIGELSGLQWDDIDFNKKVVHVKHSMAYVSNAERKYVFELHPTKTNKGLCVIPLTKKAAAALRR